MRVSEVARPTTRRLGWSSGLLFLANGVKWSTWKQRGGVRKMVEAFRTRFLSSLVTLLVLIPISAATLIGQGTSGTITGIVADPSGAIVPGASVTVLDQGKGVDFHLKTNESGVYSVTSLVPGS